MGYDTLLGVVVSSPKCAVKVVSTGEHCPETGIHKIDDTDEYLDKYNVSIDETRDKLQTYRQQKTFS